LRTKTGKQIRASALLPAPPPNVGFALIGDQLPSLALASLKLAWTALSFSDLVNIS
jgi:hypothetical protein